MSALSWRQAAAGGLSHRQRQSLLVLGIRLGTVLAILLLWQATIGSVWTSDFVTSPSRIVRAIPDVLSGDALSLVLATTYRFLGAFVIVAVLGTGVGLAVGRLARPVFLGTRDVVSVLYALPLAPFYPLFVLWLGLGNRSEIAFGVVHGLPPVILLTMSASAGVAPTIVEAGRAMGAGATTRLLRVVLPGALPEIIGSLKIGAALTLLGVLIAELMISVNGVGSYLSGAITNHQAADLDAMIVVVCVGALLVNLVLTSAERRLAYRTGRG